MRLLLQRLVIDVLDANGRQTCLPRQRRLFQRMNVLMGHGPLSKTRGAQCQSSDTRAARSIECVRGRALLFISVTTFNRQGNLQRGAGGRGGTTNLTQRYYVPHY